MMGSFCLNPPTIRDEHFLAIISCPQGVRHTVRNNDTILALYSLVGDRFGEIDGEEDGVHLTSDRIEGGLEKYFDE